MLVGTYILFVLGVLGALDIALYHSISHGIRHHSHSRTELFIHSLRGPTYAALFLLLPNFTLHGKCFWLLIALFGFDLFISIWDFAIERESRRILGGLPSGEYVLHIIIAMLFGALVATAFYEGWEWVSLPTGIRYEPNAVPQALRGVLALMAVLVLISGLQDLLAAMKLGRIPTDRGSAVQY